MGSANGGLLMYQRLSRVIVLIFLGASLAACGGGGGGGGGTPPEPPVVPQPDTIEKKISDLGFGLHSCFNEHSTDNLY